MHYALLEFTTNSSGAATATFTMPDHKPGVFLYAVEWVDGDLVDGVDAVLSAVNTASGVDTTLLTLTNANNDAWYYPRTSEHDATGTATSGTAIPVFTGNLSLSVTSGGDTKSGKCIVYYSF